jgi:ferredoxin--NADP+ reductase
MISETKGKYVAVVVGAGPAGLYAARQLALAGVQVAILNRDIKPGGVAEYGIYPNKYKIKGGLRNQFHQILEMPEIKYFGNVSVGKNGDISLNDLQAMGFQSILASVGAQGTKWLELSGEELEGVYHAKDIVYHYNKLPPFSKREYLVCCRVALIGMGNVMMDIAHWLIRDMKVNEVIAIARRGPEEVKFARKEMEYVIGNLDLEAFEAEINRCAPVMQKMGQDVQAAKNFILSALPRALEPVSKTRFRFEFLTSPTRILGDDEGKAVSIEVEDNTLVTEEGETKVRSLGVKRILDVDAVIFCIGDKVDVNFGLPVRGNEYVKNPEPRFPVDGLSYEVYDPEVGKPIEGFFLAGWSRKASSGLVGVARKDGENAADAMLQYLHTLPMVADESPVLDRLEDALKNSGKEIVSKKDVARLVAVEQSEADRLGLEDYKMETNDEMFAAIGR